MHRKVCLSIFLFSLFFCRYLDAGMPAAYNDSIECLVSRNNEVKNKIEILLTASNHIRLSDPDLGLKWATRALDMATKAVLPEFRLRALIIVGNIQVAKTRFTVAMGSALKAKELAISLNDKKNLADANLIIGIIRMFQGNYAESYEAHFTALRLFEEINDPDGIIRAMNGIGNICYYQKNYAKAIIYYENALKIAREHHDTIQIANVLNNVGLVLVEQGQITRAISCYKEAIEIHTKLNLVVQLGINYLNMGGANLVQKQFDDFIRNYREAVRLFIVAGSQHNLAMCYLLFSDYSGMQNKPDDQLRYARLAYTDGLTYKLRDVVFQATDVMHQCFLAAGKIDSAYKYAMIRNVVKDSIDNEHSTARLTLLEMEYSYEKKQKEDAFSQQKKEIYLLLIIIVVVALLIIIFLYLSRQILRVRNIRLEKKQLSDELEFKNKELTLNVMNLLKKNEFLVDHTNRLIEIQQRATDTEIQTDILNLINSLQRGTGTDIWDEFELRFRQVHSGFYEALLLKFPDLSSSELKLCALLKLNLSTKEICELTGQRPASLDVARSRLRKKLGITSSQTNLVTFLCQVSF